MKNNRMLADKVNAQSGKLSHRMVGHLDVNTRMF